MVPAGLLFSSFAEALAKADYQSSAAAVAAGYAQPKSL
jgi:hypothetical protein